MQGIMVPRVIAATKFSPTALSRQVGRWPGLTVARGALGSCRRRLVCLSGGVDDGLNRMRPLLACVRPTLQSLRFRNGEMTKMPMTALGVTHDLQAQLKRPQGLFNHRRPINGAIDFSASGNSQLYVISGRSFQDLISCWTEGTMAVLRVRPEVPDLTETQSKW